MALERLEGWFPTTLLHFGVHRKFQEVKEENLHQKDDLQISLSDFETFKMKKMDFKKEYRVEGLGEKKWI